MKYTKQLVIAAAVVFTFVTLFANDAAAGEAGHGMHEGQGHQSMGEGHKGHDNGKAKTTQAKNGFAKKPPIGTKAKCPVMGNEFVTTKDTAFSQYKGKFYAFCCPGCKPQFDKHPEKYVK